MPMKELGVSNRARWAPRIRSALTTGLTGALALGLWSSTALAQNTSFINQYFPTLRVPSDAVMFALFMGAFSFAMMSATWLIRERRRLDHDHRELALEHADLKARHERAQALLDVPDQCIAIWAGRDEQAVCRGTLPHTVGAPEDIASFIDFSSWLTPQSARPFEEAVESLRTDAESFDLTIESRKGSVIEVQGRASGSHAFVRFVSLTEDRAALARLQMQHAETLQTTGSMRSLLEALPMPAWLRDRSGSLYWVNEAYAQAVEGKSSKDVCERGLELLDAVERERVEKSHRESLKHDEKSIFKGRLPATIAGDRRTMDVCESSFSTGTAGLAVDMSEIEEGQINLRRAMEGHAQTLDQLATAVVIFDMDRKLVFNNQAFQNLWKLDAKVLENATDNAAMFDALRAEKRIAEQPDWSKWRDGLMEVYQATQPQEHWWHLPDGRTLRVIANPHKQGGVTWVFENVTEQLEMESRYIALTQVQGETLDHLKESIAVFGSDGKLKLSNPAFQKLWQLEDEEVAADTQISKIASHCRKETETPEIWDELTTGVTGVHDQRDNVVGRTALHGGTVIDYALLPLPNGQSMLSFADVTASVRMEHALTERNEALEAAEQLKNAFIEHVSYEFRAPLTNIKGFAEMLGQEAVGSLNAKQHEYVGHIESSSSVLHSLVDNILDLATVDAGIMELDMEALDLRETVQAAVKSVSELMKEQGVTLRTLLPKQTTDDDGSFVGDAYRVQQVLFNLLSNAIRFSPEGGEIVLRCKLEPDAITIRISDSGPGIPEDKRDSIFDRFESKAQSGGRKGAGLGLSIARSLLELHGGTIELDSNVAEGASFVCRFPRLPDVAAQAAQ